MPRNVTYFTPGTHVWVYTDGSGLERGVILDRQSGVYRVEFVADKRTELRKRADVRIRRT